MQLILLPMKATVHEVVRGPHMEPVFGWGKAGVPVSCIVVYQNSNVIIS